jgi:hypothetical protein
MLTIVKNYRRDRKIQWVRLTDLWQHQYVFVSTPSASRKRHESLKLSREGFSTLVTEMNDLIYRIEPQDSPFFTVNNFARFEFRKSRGGSIRKQRRRKAKPVRYTPSLRGAIIHEWVTDSLAQSMQ